MLDLVNAGHGLVGSSLQETRSVKEFLGLLKETIIPNDFHLQTLQDRQVVHVEGTIRPGEYLVGMVGIPVYDVPLSLSLHLVGEAQQYNCHYMLTFRQEAALPRGMPSGKLSTTDGEGGRSQRNNSKESAAFKSRLIACDKGCVVCIAQDQDEDAMYLYKADSELFIGAHIFPLQYYDSWDKKEYSQMVVDSYSVAIRSSNRQNSDTRRMNSTDNGLLLCVTHHIQFDAHLFSIHPDTHIVTSFHPRTKDINGLTIMQPWSNVNTCYPPPHSTLLKDHFISSIARWMSGASEGDEEDDIMTGWKLKM